MLARNRHYSLLQTFVNYGRKKLYNIGFSEQSKSLQITFDDVIGLEDAKEALEDAIILPIKHPDIYSMQSNGEN